MTSCKLRQIRNWAANFNYKFQAAFLSHLLFYSSPLASSFLKWVGLETLLQVTAVWLFRRQVVAGTNIFCPILYAKLNKKAQKSFFISLLTHLRTGEKEGLNPTYFFDTQWFQRQYADILPPGASPLVFFVLRQRRLNLMPHKQSLFQNIYGNFFRVLTTDSTGALRLTNRADISTSRISDDSGRYHFFHELDGKVSWADLSLKSAVRISDWLAHNGQPAEIIHHAVPARITALKQILGPHTLKTRTWTKCGYSSYLAKLDQVVAIGADTALCFPDGRIGRDGNLDCPATSIFTALAVFRFGKSYWLPKDRLQCWRLSSMPEYERGLLLMTQTDFNYWHWLVEVLPRIVPIVDRLNQGDLKQCPIFVSKGMPRSHIEALRVLVPANPLFFMERQMTFKIRTALYPSEINRVYESGCGLWGNFDIRMDLTILRQLRNLVLTQLPPKPVAYYPRKIIIDREPGPRALFNRDLVLAMVRKYGFELIKPENHSFVEQATIFNQATHILVPGGAGATNIMFASAGAQIGLFCNDTPDHILSLWPPLAEAAGADLTFICGKRAFIHEAGARDQIIIPPDLLDEFFKKAGLTTSNM